MPRKSLQRYTLQPEQHRYLSLPIQFSTIRHLLPFYPYFYCFNKSIENVIFISHPCFRLAPFPCILSGHCPPLRRCVHLLLYTNMYIHLSKPAVGPFFIPTEKPDHEIPTKKKLFTPFAFPCLEAKRLSFPFSWPPAGDRLLSGKRPGGIFAPRP